MEQAAATRALARRDVTAGALVAAVVLAGLGAVVLAALPATRPLPGGTRGAAGTAVVFLVIETAFALAGAVLVHRRPANPIGWLLLAVAVVDGVNRFAEHWSTLALLARPGSLPAGEAMAWLDSLTEGLVVVLLAAVVLLFPTGRPPGPLWWAALWVTVAGGAAASAARVLRPGLLEGVAFDVANPLGLPATRDLLGGVRAAALALLGGVRAAALALLVAGVVACVASLVPRWVRGDATTRLQLAWLAAAALVLGLLVPIVPLLPDPFTVLYAAGLAALPVTIAMAVLEVRLDAIAVGLHHLATGALTVVVLAGSYLVVVGVATALVGRPGDPFLVLAGAVLVAVALGPVRRWADRLVDRLTLGPRARPYEVLADLTAEVGQTVPAEQAAGHLAQVVAEGADAARVEVWAVQQHGLHLLAAWPPGRPEPRPPDRTYPVTHDGQAIGSLSLWLAPGQRLRSRDERLLADLAASAGLVLQNARLIDQLRASRQRLVEAQDAERRRLERDLHDGAQQRLLALSIEIGRARARLDHLGPCEVEGVLARANDELQHTLDELRELARGIHPAILTGGGLAPALQSLADRSPVPVVVHTDLPGRLPPPVEATAYFVACEALTNAARHAHARQVDLTATLHDGLLVVEVSDDGAGGARAQTGGGLSGLADRVEALGGSLAVRSPAGGGTSVVAEVPCASS